MAERKIVNIQSDPSHYKGEYGPYAPPIISHVFEGNHGYSNIIGPNEVPEGLGKISGLPEVNVARKLEKGSKS